MIKSPLRYPGGKSRFTKFICPMLGNFEEYREPFAGGASVFFGLFSQFGIKKHYWINDSFSDLYFFYQQLKKDRYSLVSSIRNMKHEFSDGRKLYERVLEIQKKSWNRTDRACAFFIANRITFSGVLSYGGYSQQSYEKRFTDSSICRLFEAGEAVKEAQITCFNYSYLMSEPPLYSKPEDVVIYLDPPYALDKKAMKLYGNHGDKHKNFNFEEFAENFKKCRFRCLVSLNDCEKVRSLFNGYEIISYEKYHSMKHGSGDHKIGKELLIANYEIDIKR